MASPKKEHINLLSEFYLKQRSISQVYSHVGLCGGQHNNLSVGTPLSGPVKKIYSFSYAPNYIKTVVSKPEIWTERIFPSVAGYAITLKDFDNLEDYLRSQLRNRRKAINRAVRRLEMCFDISQKMHQKDITEEHYQFLMARLRAMIIKRFEQRGETSDSLGVWDKVLSTSFDLIKQEKASLFVIYDKDNPIIISFNYNYGTRLFSYISCYDIDYSKFSPGQIEIYKQLEWCMNNGYDQFDIGWGDMNYKKWWSNTTYRFDHRILYPKNSISGYLYAMLKGNRSRVLAFLIGRGVNHRLNKIKKMLKKTNEKAHNTPKYNFEDAVPSPSEPLKEIDLRQKNIPITKQIINDFLFLTQEHSNDVSVYYSSAKNNYLLKGKKAAKTVLFNTTNQ